MIRTIVLSTLVLLLILLILAVVVLPALIAFNRNHRYKWAILALTLIGSWTVVAWIGALVWALTGGGARDRIGEDDGGTPPSRWSPMASTGTATLLDGRRRVSPQLVLGIIVMPIVFSWLTLRRGHSTRARILALGYCAVIVLGAGIYLKGRLVEAAADEAGMRTAIRNHLYLATSVDHVAAAAAGGRHADYRGRVLYMDANIVSMTPRSGHTDIELLGRGGARITVNGDYLVGLKPGDEATVACASVAHRMESITKCLATPAGSLPLPAGAAVIQDDGRGVASGSQSPQNQMGTGPEATRVGPPAPATGSEPIGDTPHDGFNKPMVDNPFGP